MTTSDDGPQEVEDDAIDQAFAAYLRLVDAGGVPDLESFLASQPTLSSALRELIATASTVQLMAAGNGIWGDTAKSQPTEAIETLPIGMNRLIDGEESPADAVEAFGEYELIEELGRGGMGVVFKALQKSMNRLIALKMIIGGRYSSAESVRRFYQEAKAAGKLNHRNIVRAYAAGEHDGHHFFAMELVDGCTLRDILTTSRDELPAATVARYMKALAEAVQFAHERGILHRDLKPSNIIIDNNDVPKIADFGLAKHLSLDEECSFESSSGAILGTPSYMSPEQAGSRRDQVGAASDVYSLGAILYEMLTGQPPFKDESPVGTLLLVLHQDVVPPSGINPRCHRDLEAICLKCLEKKPGNRYGSCEELATDFDHVLRGEPVKARRLNSLQKAWFWLRGIPLVAYAMGRDPGNASKAQRRTQWATLIVLTLFFVLCTAFSDIREYAYLRSVEIGVGERGGEYDRIGNMLAETFGGRATIVNTAGSLDSRDRLLHYRVDLCILQDNTVEYEDVLIVTPLYREAILIVARRSSGIEEVADVAAKAIALGEPTSGSRATSDQILDNLGISTNPRYRDHSWTDLGINDSLDGAIVTVAPRDDRLRRLLGSAEFRIVPLKLDEFPNRFRPVLFAQGEFPEGAEIGTEGLVAATTEAVLAVRKSAPFWFVRQCLERMYESNHRGLDVDIMDPRDAAVWSEDKSLHEAARRYFRWKSESAAL